MRFLIVQHDDDTPLGSLGAPLEARGAIDTWLPANEPAPPAAVGAYDGLVVLGGITHPDQDEEFPWLQPELAVLREALDQGVPILGVCLGGQLLARAAGGWIGRAETSEVGWYPIRLEPPAAEDPVVGGLADGFHAFEWHHYRFDPPPEAVTLATTPVACQAYRLGDRAWGLQFHIEVDAAIVGTWLDDPYGVADLEAHGVDADTIREASRRHEAAYVERATDLAERFAETARALRRGGA